MMPTDRNLTRQRRFWTQRAGSWDHHAQPGDVAVDLGCGSGQVTLALAPLVSSVIAVDISPEMIRLLLDHCEESGIGNVKGQAQAVEHLHLEPGSIDLVVSNYALHHLRDDDKAVAVQQAFSWLRPGGRLVIGDMMFGLGIEARDREIIASKVGYFVGKGPAGWWRIAKNGARYLLRLQERPISMASWRKLLLEAGFVQVSGTEVVSEAAVVRGVKPL
jgi:ubiquinone/menaquinone biosynthesis C-methylase UbiE